MTRRLFPFGPCLLVLCLGLSGCKNMSRTTEAAGSGTTGPVTAGNEPRSVAALQLYPNFAEVKASVPLQGGQYVLHGESDPELLTDTATLEGVEVLSQTATDSEGWLGSLEGQEMTLYVNSKPKSVTLIRARDLLVRDWNGKYRRVKAEQLAFNRPPPLTGQRSAQTLTFRTAGGNSATLSYLTRGLSWAPRYTLNLRGDAAVLTGLADIHNPGDQTYDVKNTELISGEVNILGESPYAEERYVAPAAPAPMISSRPTSAANTVRAAGESRGLHRFRLDRGFTLPARSTTSLPFLTPKVTITRLNTFQTEFSTGMDTGTAQRSYRLKTSAYLPGGALLIRDEGRVVGQDNLPETAANDPVELDLGRDPELTFTRTVQTVQRDAKREQFKVSYVLQNNKSVPARVRVTEDLSGLTMRVLTVSGDAVLSGRDATFVAELPAGGKLTRGFTVNTRRWDKK